MTKKELAAWNRGYLIACCNLVNLHDQPTMAADVLAELGLTDADIAAADLSEYDAAALAEIRHSNGIGRDPIKPTT